MRDGKVTSREAHPIRAAERRQNLATAGGRGFRCDRDERRRRERIFRRSAAHARRLRNHGLPWLGSSSAPRLNDAAAPRYPSHLHRSASTSSERRSRWIYLFRPTNGAGNAINAERLVNLTVHDYSLEPNVTFTPDGKWIVFRSNLFGETHVYAVEVGKR